MPVTKKQGAIFAIYADSPVARTSRSQATDPSDSTPVRSSKKSTSTTTTTTILGTTKKRVVGERKALGALAPAPSSRLVVDDKSINDEGKGKGKQDTVPLATADGTENAKSTLGVRRLPPRKREVSIATAAKTHGSPTKKTRSTPIKPAVLATELTDTMTSDSPASRTRSKTKVESIFEGSPIRARNTLTPRGVSKLAKNVDNETETPVDIEAILGDGRGAINAKSGRSVAALLKSVLQVDNDDNDENRPSGSGSGPGSGSGSRILTARGLSPEHEQVINDLKKGGVISKTKGLRVVELLKENEPPKSKTKTRSPVGRVFELRESTPRSVKRTTGNIESVTPLKNVGKSGKERTVLADSPLADVSEAYGASGSEPLGFRDVYK